MSRPEPTDSLLVRTLAPPPASIDDVLKVMEAIASAIPGPDGIAQFNRLYYKVTQEVGRSVGGRTFEDIAFITRLDVLFAGRYFRALRQYLSDGGAPRSWRALFESRHRSGVSALRFAVAGMNAHINFDLALSLVETAAERGLVLDAGTPQHRDYERINRLLGDTMPAAKVWFSTGLIGVADEALGPKDDHVAIWSIGRAREAAWVHAETLAALQGVPRLAARFVDTLDRSVGLASHALLAPRTPFAT
jgi:Family of unknown function (DUF5995)